MALNSIGSSFTLIRIGTEISSPQTGETLIFRSTEDSSNGELFRAELIAKPGPYVARAHIHPSQVESFVVLEGKFGYRIGDEEGVGEPGETLVVPIGVPHNQWNAGDGIMRMYYEHRPALASAEIFFETYFGLSREGKLSPNGDVGLLQAAVLLHEVRDFIQVTKPPIALQKLAFPVLSAIGKRTGYRARYEKYALPTQ